MGNLISRAIRQHHAALAQAGGVDARIVFNNDDLAMRIIPLRAGVDPSDIGDQTSTERQAQFGIAADELIFGGVKVEPQAGMEIRLTDPGVEGRYKVVPGPNGRCFDPMDSVGVMYRTYTVFKGPVSE